jgi:hypothetical protein
VDAPTESADVESARRVELASKLGSESTCEFASELGCELGGALGCELGGALESALVEAASDVTPGEVTKTSMVHASVQSPSLTVRVTLTVLGLLAVKVGFCAVGSLNAPDVAFQA